MCPSGCEPATPDICYMEGGGALCVVRGQDERERVLMKSMGGYDARGKS